MGGHQYFVAGDAKVIFDSKMELLCAERLITST